MIKLTYEFKTQEELMSHLAKLGKTAPVMEAPKADTSAIMGDKEDTSDSIDYSSLNAKDAAAYVRDCTDEDELMKIHATESRATVIKELEKKGFVSQEEEIVSEKAPSTSPGQQAFNRDACLDNIKNMIGNLEQVMDGEGIATTLTDIFNNLGIAPQKIGDLDTSNLINFKMAFDKKFKELTQPQQAQTNSFI